MILVSHFSIDAVENIIVILAFPELIIQIVAGEKYMDAVPLLQLTMLYGLFVPFAVQFGTILDSTGYPRVNFIYTTLGALVNVLFNYLFITYFGVVGAAYGTLMTFLVMFVAMQVELSRRFNVKLLQVLANIPFVYRRVWEKFKPSF